MAKCEDGNTWHQAMATTQCWYSIIAIMTTPYTWHFNNALSVIVQWDIVHKGTCLLIFGVL